MFNKVGSCCVIIKILQMNIVGKIKETLTNPKESIVLVAGLGLLGFYGLYARKQISDEKPKEVRKNSLDLGLKQLVEAQKQQNYFKIVITQSSPLSIEFKSLIVTRLKQFLISQQLNTLINCAPLKLFHAGSEVFVNTLQPEDPDDEQQYMSYFENGLRCQLIIEKTIVDIDRIKNKNKNNYILCDTNSMDLKAHAEPTLWNKFILKNKINQNDLKDNYKMVFHIEKFGPEVPTHLLGKNFKEFRNYDENIDQKITDAWRGFKNYYIISYKPHLIMEQNVENAIQSIIERLKPILPPGIHYEKRRVFARRW